MAGVSGIGGGGGGPGRIPPQGDDNNEKSKPVSFGGHDIVYGGGDDNSDSSSSSSDSSIKGKVTGLLMEGFQVLTPKEVDEMRKASISPSEGKSKPGVFSRVWSAVKGVFTGGGKSKEPQKPIDISSPSIPGYQKHGVRLPEARAMQAHWQTQGVQNKSFSTDAADTTEDIDTGDTDVTGVDTGEVPVDSLVDISTDSSKASTSSGRSGFGGGLAARVRGWWDFTTRKQEAPVEGMTGMTLGELVNMVRIYDQMIAETDNKKERKEFTTYRDAYQTHVNTMLSSGATSLTDRYNLIDNSITSTTSTFSSKKYDDQVGEGIFLDMDTDLSHVFEEELLDAVGRGEDADSILGDISPEAKKVLDEANKLRLQFDAGISESATPTLRERIKTALQKLYQGIVNILTIIKVNLVALARLVKKGLQSLGELVKRCCVRRRGYYSFLPQDNDAYVEEVKRFIQKHTDSSDPYEPGALTIPATVVQAWVDGVPDVVYISAVSGKYGHEVVQSRDSNSREVPYEVIGAGWFSYENEPLYEDMRPVLPDNDPNYETMGTIYDQPRWSDRKDEGNIYDVPSFQDRTFIEPGNNEENIYDTPQSVNGYDTPRSLRRGAGENLYDVPRNFNNNNHGYIVPDNQVRPNLGVTPGFGNGVGAASFAQQIDQLLEEPLWHRPLPPLPGGRRTYDPNNTTNNRPSPPLTPLDTPPGTPYGSGSRMMQMMKQVQARVRDFKNRRKDK
ncbi:hypothetical protein C834K_0288 [Chlamydia poikilotherma]|uniref:Uncharacterized protein n=1 Tax=Chlamydia poikilotherma TaxID=1967783 RepID=A0A3B0PNV7_9CHLA|nr:hypothetical protein [Chlamydia poikilotherma]SYX08760.1 hypothetical protein C834K_0288 [Chlamydia poikilotherma]